MFSVRQSTFIYPAPEGTFCYHSGYLQMPIEKAHPIRGRSTSLYFQVTTAPNYDSRNSLKSLNEEALPNRKDTLSYSTEDPFYSNGIINLLLRDWRLTSPLERGCWSKDSISTANYCASSVLVDLLYFQERRKSTIYHTVAFTHLLNSLTAGIVTRECSLLSISSCKNLSSWFPSTVIFSLCALRFFM